MGLEFMESATPYLTSDGTDATQNALSLASLLRRWTGAIQSSYVTVVSGTNRDGRAIAIGPGATISKTLTQQNAWVIGYAVYMQNRDMGSVVAYEGRNNGTRIIELNLNFDSTLSLYAGTNFSQIIGTSGIKLQVNTWYYIEIKYTLTTNGANKVVVTASLTVNGNQEISGTAVSDVTYTDLINQQATVNRHEFSYGPFFKDLYILSGDVPLWGDVHLGKIMPNGDVVTNWSSTGSPHYAQVNEIPPDDDTTYISSNTPAQLENFDWEDISPFSGTIKGIQYSILARKDGEGTRSIKHTIGAAQITPFDAVFVSDDYIWFHVPMETDPTDGAWTVASLNAQKFGVKLNS